MAYSLLLEGGTRIEREKMCYQVNTSSLRDTMHDCNDFLCSLIVQFSIHQVSFFTHFKHNNVSIYNHTHTSERQIFHLAYISVITRRIDHHTNHTVIVMNGFGKNTLRFVGTLLTIL